MKVDLTYSARVNKKYVQDWWTERGPDRPKASISMLAGITTVPCIIIVYWVAEMTGWPEDLKEHADFLVRFYGYTEFLNKPEGCPW